MIKIYLSPSDQAANTYAAGNTTEAIQCRRIADAAQAALERCGFDVKNNQTDSMYTRVSQSNSWAADLHICIHTNAYNGKVMGTRAFCWNTSGDGYKATKAIFDELAPITPGTSENIKADPSLYEIKDTKAPCAYIECEFHDTMEGAMWIVDHVTEIGEAICRGVCKYEKVKYVEPSSAEEKPIKEETKEELVEVKLPLLHKGWTGGYVRTAQILLNAYYNAGLTVDGVFGVNTDKAVRAYQKDRKLQVDGYIGAETWGRLLK